MSLKIIYMRYIKFAFVILFFGESCDPPRDMSMGTIAIKAEVINPRTSISLGDSVAFYFEVPDTVLLNGNRIKVSASTNDGGSNGFHTNKINSSEIAGYEVNSSSCKIYANPGQVGPTGDLVFTNQGGKLFGMFYMIPQQKGIYFFQQTQLGYVDLNNQSLKLRFNFNFGNINRNHQMLIDSAGASNNFNLYLQDKLNQGLEVYGFRVN